ncbi:hypothetical protein Tco_1258085 [Tanacetum coccineum]
MMVVEGSGGGWLGCVIVAWFHSNEGGSLVPMMAVKRKQKSFFRLLKRKQVVQIQMEPMQDFRLMLVSIRAV